MATRYEPPVAKAAESLRAALTRYGYTFVKPPWEDAFAAKGPYLLAITYDPRDSASITFGRQSTDIDARFFPMGIDWSKQRPFGLLLREAGQKPEQFIKALGGWVDDGLRTPDFTVLSSAILEHLSRIEGLVSAE